jgi:hypothetical protein
MCLACFTGQQRGLSDQAQRVWRIFCTKAVVEKPDTKGMAKAVPPQRAMAWVSAKVAMS